MTRVGLFLNIKMSKTCFFTLYYTRKLLATTICHLVIENSYLVASWKHKKKLISDPESWWEKYKHLVFLWIWNKPTRICFKCKPFHSCVLLWIQSISNFMVFVGIVLLNVCWLMVIIPTRWTCGVWAVFSLKY